MEVNEFWGEGEGEVARFAETLDDDKSYFA